MNVVTKPTDSASAGYGSLIEPGTLRIERLLHGPIERVWSYLVDGEMRARWLAGGAMELRVDAPFELVWRNDELTDPPGAKPDGFGVEHRMASRITEIDPPRRLAFTWGTAGGSVTFELETVGGKVLLTLTHRRIADRAMVLMVGPGWHAHLDVLAARLAGENPAPFWDAWLALKADYAARLPE